MKMGIIYLVTNLVTGKEYIGKTVQAKADRWKQHWKDAEAGRGWAIAAAIRKYGKENFRVEEEIPESFEDCLPQLEIFFIALHNTTDKRFGYNLTKGGDGVPCTDAMRAKMSASGRCRPPITEKTRAKLIAWQVGKVISAEQRKKLSVALTGRVVPREQVERMVSSNTGKRRSVVTKQNMSELAPKGKDHHMWGKYASEETKAKTSASLLKHYETNSKPPTSDDTRLKMSLAKKNDPKTTERMKAIAAVRKGKPAANRGSTHTPETKAKMKAYWAARREAKAA